MLKHERTFWVFSLGAILWVASGFCCYDFYPTVCSVWLRISAVNTFTYISRDHVVTGNSMSLSEIIFKFTHFEMLPFMNYHCGSIFQLSRIQYDKFYVETAPDFRKDSTRCILLKGTHCTTFSSVTSPW